MSLSERAVSKCLTVLGVRRDPMRPVWRRASREWRLFFLHCAHLSADLHGKSYDDLCPRTQQRLSNRVFELKKFLNDSLVPGEQGSLFDEDCYPQNEQQSISVASHGAAIYKYFSDGDRCAPS